MKMLEAKKRPEDLQKLVSAISSNASEIPRAQFQKNLRTKLMMKHKEVMREGSVARFTWPKFNFGSLNKGWAFVVAILLVITVGFASYPFIPAPEVQGYNLRANVRKISYNAPIKVVFTQLMDHGSVEKAFRVNPQVEGRFDWSGNALMFYPKDQFKVGQTFNVFVDRAAKSIFQKSLRYDYEEVFEITGPPQVLLFSPAASSVDVPIDAQITMHFDRPMTQLTTLDQGVENAIAVKIDPPTNGKMKWLGTDSIRFIPDKLAYSTHYTLTIPKGTFSAEGGQTDQDFVATFDTLKPELINTVPLNLGKYNGPQLFFSDLSDFPASSSNIQLLFNQIMNADKASSKIHLWSYKGDKNRLKFFGCGGDCPQSTNISGSGKSAPQSTEDVLKQFNANDWAEVPFQVSYYTLNQFKTDSEYKEGDTQITLPEPEELKKTLMLSPAQPLGYDQYYLVKVDKDFGGVEGTLTLGEDKGILFKTVGEITVNSTAPKNGVKDYPLSGGISLTFSQPMDLDSIKEKFAIEPKSIDADTKLENQPDLTLSLSDTVLNVSYAIKPSTDYKITIQKGVKDQFGKTLNQDFVLTFKTAAISPTFEVMSPTDITVVDANKPTVFYVKSTNVDTMNLNFKKLSEEEFKKIYQRGYIDWRSNIPAGPFTSFSKTIAKQFNQTVTTKIDLGKETNMAMAPGYYYFDVSSPQVKNPYAGQDGALNLRIERHIFMVSYSGLTMKMSPTKLLIWATNFADGAPNAGMDISVIQNGSTDGKALYSGKTDQNGLVTFDLPASAGSENIYNRQYLIFGKKNNDITLTHTTWSEGVDPSSFNIDYNPYAPKYYAYVYMDRPIYRPGNTVYFKGILRVDKDAAFKLPDVKQAMVTIDDSMGNAVYSKTLDLNANGSFAGELQLGNQAATGDYFLNVAVGNNGVVTGKGQSNVIGSYQSFHVAEYRKPDYQINLNTDKKSYVNGDTLKLKVKASYFFGAPLPNAPIQWTVKSQDYFFFLNSDNNLSPFFSFSDEGYSCYFGCQGQTAVVSQGKAKLDANGEYTIELPLNIADKKMSQFYTVEVTAFDLNNQSVSDRVTVSVHEGEYYVGIMSINDVVQAGKEAKFDLVSVDENGKVVGGKSTEVTLYKRNWNTVKKKNVDSDYYFENSYDDVLIEKKTVTTDNQGKANVSFIPKEGGVFKVGTESKDSRGNKITSSTTVYVSSGSFVNWGQANNDRIELVADKQEYKIGDTAHVMVKSPYQNVYALVTYERGEILDKKVIKIKSNSDVIDVPITDKSIPNEFVSVVLIKGDNNQAGLAQPTGKDAIDERSVASFKMGYATLQVDTSSRKLLVSVQTNQQKYHPGDEVTINVKTTDVNGKPVKAEMSLSVVDKSVLSLVENFTADLLNDFYRKRSLGVMTSETLTKALSRINVQVESGLKGGGGGTLQKRGNFKDTAYWQAALNTNEQGVGTIKFKLPDNLTTWQILAIGATANTLVGSQKTDFIVSKDVLVRPILPRFLIVNDEITVGTIVHNYLTNAVDLDVSVEASGVTLNGSNKQRIHLGSGEEKKVEFKATVLDEAEAVITFKAIAVNDSNIGDILENKMPIHPYSFPETVATSTVIDNGDKHVETVWLPNNIDPKFGKLTIAVAPTLASSITKGIEYLMTYPYGCAEQVASALLPNVTIKQMLSLPALGKIAAKLVDQKTLQKNVESGLQALYKLQQGNGGWGLWETSEATPHLTSYVLFALNESKKAGYTVDDNVMNRGVNFLKSKIGSNSVKISQLTNSTLSSTKYDKYNLDSRAFALYVLAEMGKGDLALSNNLFDLRKNLNLSAQAYLVMDLQKLITQEKLGGAALQEVQKKIDTIKNEILARAKESPRGVHFEENTLDYQFFDTNNRTTALILQMLNRLDPANPLVPKMLRYMLLEKKNGHFASTQETAVSLMALIEYLKTSGELNVDYDGIVTVNGAEKLHKGFTENNIEAREEVTIPLKDLLQNNLDNEITAVRNGNGKMYFDMNLQYFLPTEQIKARDEGIEVHQQYFATDDKKEENPLTSIKVGENLKGKMTIIVPEDSYYVLVEDFLPAGLEGVDFSLKTSEQQLQDQNDGKGSMCLTWDCYNELWRFNHSEVLDDRMTYFADFLPKGVYEINYFVRATTPGTYHDLPAMASETYFPEVFGRSEGRMFMVTN